MNDLLLLPGFMCDDDLWTDTKAGFTALGKTMLGEFGTGTSLSGIAAHVLETAPEHFVLIGFSMGGYVAQEIVLKAPDRVKALILIGTSAQGDDAKKTKQKTDLVAITRNSTYRGLSSAAFRSSLHPDRADDEALMGRLQAMALRLGKASFIRQLSVSREDQHEKLKDIRCPTLVIAARQDQLRSVDDSQRLASSIPDATLSIIEECGHMMPMEKPDQLLNIIGQWLLNTDNKG